jgi:hypothetical protein
LSTQVETWGIERFNPSFGSSGSLCDGIDPGSDFESKAKTPGIKGTKYRNLKAFASLSLYLVALI